jgi:hypothetical protein
MKRIQKRRAAKKNSNQLSFDFTSNIPIEIHTPRLEHSLLKKELAWDRKTAIELVRG